MKRKFISKIRIDRYEKYEEVNLNKMRFLVMWMNLVKSPLRRFRK